MSIDLWNNCQSKLQTSENNISMVKLKSDYEDYKMANKKTYKDLKEGYEAGNFLIRKYINIVKYLFDKLRVLSSTNYTKDIHLTANDIKNLCGKSLSNRYTYLDIDIETGMIYQKQLNDIEDSISPPSNNLQPTIYNNQESPEIF